VEQFDARSRSAQFEDPFGAASCLSSAQLDEVFSGFSVANSRIDVIKIKTGLGITIVSEENLELKICMFDYDTDGSVSRRDFEKTLRTDNRSVAS
jgi:hypothetical protein